jgi:hypothetical protein
MTIFDEISIIANKLANEGKVPSVALIKGHLSQAVPLPKIISALKNWHHEPDFIKASHQVTSSEKSTEVKPGSEELSLLIAEALAPLKDEIAELKQQIKALTDNLAN